MTVPAVLLRVGVSLCVCVCVCVCGGTGSLPDAVVDISCDEDLPTALTTNVGLDLRELAGGAGSLDSLRLDGGLVLEETGGVPPATEDELGVVFGGRNDGFLDVGVDGRFCDVC